MQRVPQTPNEMFNEIEVGGHDPRLNSLRAALRRSGRHHHVGLKNADELAVAGWLFCDSKVQATAQAVLREVWE